jgi:hypothetical protein
VQAHRCDVDTLAKPHAGDTRWRARACSLSSCCCSPHARSIKAQASGHNGRRMLAPHPSHLAGVVRHSCCCETLKPYTCSDTGVSTSRVHPFLTGGRGSWTTGLCGGSVHVVFVSDCSPTGDWQAEGLIHSWAQTGPQVPAIPCHPTLHPSPPHSPPHPTRRNPLRFRFSAAGESSSSVATLQAARGRARPPCRPFKIQSCCCLASAFELVAAFQTLSGRSAQPKVRATDCRCGPV